MALHRLVRALEAPLRTAAQLMPSFQSVDRTPKASFTQVPPPLASCIVHHMQRTPWHTEHWFTSPWNHDPAVAADYRFPEQVTIHDVTLRDGEQQAGVEFTAEQKLRIAEGLAEAGIQRIEAGLPAVSPEDEKAVA